MTHKLTLELPEEIYQPVKRAAEQSGQTPEEWAVARLRSAVPAVDRAAALERLLRHAGAVDLGRPTGADNDQIDADLAKEYGDTHNGRP
jgi:hypothetical protein